eukprot:s762_g7.t1
MHFIFLERDCGDGLTAVCLDGAELPLRDPKYRDAKMATEKARLSPIGEDVAVDASLQLSDLSGEKSSSCSDFLVPGFPSTLSDTESDDFRRESDDLQPKFNTWEAHKAGKCRPCRFLTRTGGCRLGDACEFCHFCSKEAAREAKLQAKYQERRAKRLQRPPPQ